MKVIGRKSEIGQIRKLYDSGKSEFVVVYGRRRVGKTFLVNQFFDNKFLFKVTGLAVKDKAAQLVKFFEAKVENEKLALEALSYIRRLYDVEAKRMLLTRQTTNPTMSAGRPCGRKRLIRKSRSSRRGWRQASSSALRSL